MKLFRSFFVLSFLSLFLLTSCSDSESVDTNDPDHDEPKPITLKVHFGQDENFIQSFIEPAEAKFPHITFEHVEGSYSELIAAGDTPDILFHWNRGGYTAAAEHELIYDMTELAEEVGFDLSKYDQNHLDEWKAAANGKLWALPIMTSRFALLYNKDIFDVFGVDYPRDGMTWEEVVNLARQVTGERNGVEYYGMYMPKHEAPIFWTVGNLVDPDTDEPTWTSDERVREYFQLYREAYSIPGNPYIPEHWEAGGWAELFEQGRLAMVPQFFAVPNPEANINWDIATYPEPINGLPARGWAFGISAASEHKAEIMKVFDFWLSDEQILNNTFIRGPLYVPFAHLYENGSALEKALEREGDIWEGKNMEALFSLPVATPPEKISKYNDSGVVEAALYEYAMNEDIDLNTLMREKYEEEVTRIKEMKGRE